MPLICHKEGKIMDLTKILIRSIENQSLALRLQGPLFPPPVENVGRFAMDWAQLLFSLSHGEKPIHKLASITCKFLFWIERNELPQFAVKAAEEPEWIALTAHTIQTIKRHWPTAIIVPDNPHITPPKYPLFQGFRHTLKPETCEAVQRIKDILDPIIDSPEATYFLCYYFLPCRIEKDNLIYTYQPFTVSANNARLVIFIPCEVAPEPKPEEKGPITCTPS